MLLFTTTLGKHEPRWNNFLESVTSFYVVLAQLSDGSDYFVFNLGRHKFRDCSYKSYN